LGTALILTIPKTSKYKTIIESSFYTMFFFLNLMYTGMYIF